jgi:serine/threonine protein kinase
MTSEKNTRLWASLTPGTVLMGKYRVMDILGTGNFAIVVRAHHLSMGRDVALKLLKPEVVDAHPEVAQRFLAEVKIVSRLSHPNTVTIYDFGRMPEGILYMVLEHVDGKPIDALLDGKRLSIPRVSKIVRQILKSLDEAHSLGVVHRDLKPSNIMILDRHGESDLVKVLDFGVAKLIGDDDENRASQAGVRRSTQFIGTPIYMSPEQVLGQRVSPASDIYSLGLLLYEMLSGSPPIDDSLNVAGVAQIHIDDRPIPFKYLDRLPPEWGEVILKATSRHPEDRFQTVREFARALPAEASADATGEFARLMAPTEDLEIPDVFKGAGYVEREDDEEIPLLQLARRPAAAEAAVPSREPRKFRPESDLQLDVAKVRKQDVERRRVQQAPQQSHRSLELNPMHFVWIGAGLVSFVITWHLAGTFVPAHGASIRAVVGLVPAGLALIWAFFSEVRNVHGSVFDRWIVPCAQSMFYLGASLILSAAIVFPEHAAKSLIDHADWPHALGLPAFDVWSGMLTDVFILTSSLVPW